MARPLKINGTSGLKEMTDTELDGICYLLRVAYAAQVNGGGNGSLNVGGAGTVIGSAADTSSTRVTASQGRNYSGAADYPATPALGTETDNTYSYKQVQTVPSFPSAATLDADAYMIINGTSGIRVANTAAHFYDEILAQTIVDMRTGDQVGTYKVQGSTPGTGWVDKGAFFVDSTYLATSTVKLWLKTSATASAVTLPVELNSTSGIRESSGTFNQNHSMIQNILLPALTRRISNGNLVYSVAAATAGTNRGVFTDTKITTSTTTSGFSNPTYTRTSTPSGAAVVQSTFYFNLA